MDDFLLRNSDSTSTTVRHVDEIRLHWMIYVTTQLPRTFLGDRTTSRTMNDILWMELGFGQIGMDDTRPRAGSRRVRQNVALESFNVFFLKFRLSLGSLGVREAVTVYGGSLLILGLNKVSLVSLCHRDKYKMTK